MIRGTHEVAMILKVGWGPRRSHDYRSGHTEAYGRLSEMGCLSSVEASGRSQVPSFIGPMSVCHVTERSVIFVE